jgi:hypothetical protein
MSEENKKTKNINWLVSIIVFVVIIIWSIGWLLIDINIKQADRGVFGDKFGAVNALFSALAFAGIIITILLQKKELSLQRKEMEDTRKEFEKQNSTLEIQKFENTFFHLLEVHRENVKMIDFRKEADSSKVVATGRDCFKNFYEKKLFRQNCNGSSIQESIKAYKTFHSLYRNDIEHYFRHLYHILKFVANSDVKDKKTYTNFVRAQLSSYELVVIFYNGLSEYGSEKMKPLLENYSILKTLDDSLLFNETHKEAYCKEAFGE